jgi:superfamily I DNA/RNA helicase
VIANNSGRREKRLRTANGVGPRIDLWQFAETGAAPAETQEAEMIAREIQIRRLHEKLGWGDFAVLYRTNLQARPLEEALRAGNVPYRVVGGTSYFDRKEVADCVAYLRVALNPRDEVSLRRIVNYPSRGIGRTTLMRLVEGARAAKRSVWESLRHVDEAAEVSRAQREPVREFVTMMEELRAELAATQAGLGPGGERTLQGFVRDLVRRVRLEEAVRADNAKSERAAEVRVDILRDFIASVGAYEARIWAARPLPDEEDDWEPPSLRQFLERISLNDEDDDRREEEDDSADRVTLMTMHAAKGLEFTHVFIVGLEEDILPHTRSVAAVGDGDGGDPIAEERRLFYVGITRARHRLTLSGCGTRRQRGEPVIRQPSRFLAEVPEELLERRGAAQTSSLSTEEQHEFRKNFFSNVRAMLGD